MRLWLLFTLIALVPRIEPVRLELSQKVSATSVSELHLRVWIEPDDQNRLLVVTGTSDEFYRSSSESLDGAQARRVREIWWRSMPCGVYGFRAATFDQAGNMNHSATERAEFCPQREGL